MNLGFLGFGTIANAVARGIAADGHAFVLSQRTPALSTAFARDVPDTQVLPNAKMVAAVDVVFVGLLPSQLAEVLPDLPFRAGQKVISFAAGITRADIAPLVAPAEVEAVMIPFPSIATGGSPILTVPSSPLLETLFGPRNTLFAAQSEADLAPFMAAQSLLLSIAKFAGDGADWLADKTGDPARAESFMRSLIASSLTSAPLDQTGALTTLQAELSTPGGFNAAMRDHLSAADAYKALQSGLDLMLNRANRS